ncbi:unnamed protein product [Adineta steineri]|uniref:N-acetyltransferase domain-containing protein n=1 Tax=Adineta steineri TaxID=433720 RepID=A0A819YJQ1_9BILA|nr:unnamed protein product [Adineta steineri]
MTHNEEYVYELIHDETTARICAHLLADEFVAHEPFTNFSLVSSKDLYDEIVWPSMLDALSDGLSFLARHRSSGEIVAAIIADDLYFGHKKHPYNPSGPPACTPVIDILDEMDDMFINRDFGQELKPHMVLHIWMGATRADHSGKGLATRLREVTIDHARDVKGFQYVFVQATGPATRHIYLKMGGKIVTEVDPTTWIWKKKDNGISCPYKNYNKGHIPNILIKMTQNGGN